MKKLTKSLLLFPIISLIGFAAFAQTTIVTAGSLWKYLDNGSNPGTAWKEVAFIDTAWASGNAQLGYGEGDEATVVKYGPDKTSKYITTYFRKSVYVSDVSIYNDYVLNVKRDDGVVVYINGIEKFRNNMPTGTIAYNTLAATTCSDDGTAWQTINLPAGTLVTGTNTIAVEIHQCYPDNSDISFELEFKGNTISDTIAPLVSSYSPSGTAINVEDTSNLVITFNEDVQKGAGDITIKQDGIITQTINVTSTAVSIIGATVVIAPVNFNAGAVVNIEIDAGTFKDNANNDFEGINNTTGWNFSIASPEPEPILVAAGASWKYLDNGTNQGTAWKDAAFNDVTWAEGNAELGYGDGDETTIIKYGSSSSSKYITTYFRKSISVANASLYSSYTLNVRRDDGVVIYINGAEKFRSNMPTGTITYTTLTPNAASDDGDVWQTFTLPAGSLVTGTNVIAAEIHQNTPGSSDVSFDLELKTTNSTDITAPLATVFSPADDASNIAASAPLIITFNENVKKGSGTIIIKEAGVITQTIDVTSSAVMISDSIVTINAAKFSNGAAVNIEMSTGTFKDIANNNFAGINIATAWNFSIQNSAIMTALARGPYLQTGTTNSVIIKWRSAAANNSVVRYGSAVGNLTSTISNASVVTDHEMKLINLVPDTKYFYSIGSSSQTLQGDADNYFVTAPLTGTEKKIRIWVNGDCGNNSTNQLRVSNQYKNYVGINYTDVWLLLGDNAYENGTDSEYQAKFFNIYQDKILKQSVLWPVPGNHDYANNDTSANTHAVPYYTIFSLPAAAEAGGVASNSEAFYSFNRGNIHFIALDSYGKESNQYRLYDTLGPQIVWLKKDLAANTQKWTIVYFHHPPYTMGSHNSDTENELVQIRQNLLKILERYKVDMVMCGHSHDYERTKLMTGHYGNEASFDPALHNLSTSTGRYDGVAGSCPYVKSNATNFNGTVYVVAGSSGQLSSKVNVSWPHAAMNYADAANGGAVAIEVEGNRLDAKWICADGVIRDQFTILKNVNTSKKNTITAGQSTTLTASWNGSYNWSPFSATTKSITVSPANTSTYIVKDIENCLSDTFTVTVNAALARPVKQNSLQQQTGENIAMKIYPNPLTNQTIIEYSTTYTTKVKLEMYDIAGRKINTLISQSQQTGSYKYVLNTKNEQVKAGVYFIKLSSDRQNITQRITVLE